MATIDFSSMLAAAVVGLLWLHWLVGYLLMLLLALEVATLKLLHVIGAAVVALRLRTYFLIGAFAFGLHWTIVAALRLERVAFDDEVASVAVLLVRDD